MTVAVSFSSGATSAPERCKFRCSGPAPRPEYSGWTMGLCLVPVQKGFSPKKGDTPEEDNRAEIPGTGSSSHRAPLHPLPPGCDYCALSIIDVFPPALRPAPTRAAFSRQNALRTKYCFQARLDSEEDFRSCTCRRSADHIPADCWHTQCP